MGTNFVTNAVGITRIVDVKKPYRLKISNKELEIFLIYEYKLMKIANTIKFLFSRRAQHIKAIEQEEAN